MSRETLPFSAYRGFNLKFGNILTMYSQISIYYHQNETGVSRTDTAVTGPSPTLLWDVQQYVTNHR
jgi:hypothetical protein